MSGGRRDCSKFLIQASETYLSLLKAVHQLRIFIPQFNSAGNSVCTDLQHKLAFSKMPLRVPKPERFCRFKNTTIPPKDPVYRTLGSACDRKLNHSYRWRIWKWDDLKWFKRPISTERNERGNFWRRWEWLPLCTSLYQAPVPKWLDRWHAPLRGSSWNP